MQNGDEKMNQILTGIKERLSDYLLPNEKSALVNFETEIAELKADLEKAINKALDNAKIINELKDKLTRRNKQIKVLQKDREECLRLSALLGRLGYDLKGNRNR